MCSSYSFTTSALEGVSGQGHALAALYPPGKDSRYPFDRRLGGPQRYLEGTGFKSQSKCVFLQVSV
jgi:hypothetical protein